MWCSCASRILTEEIEHFRCGKAVPSRAVALLPISSMMGTRRSSWTNPALWVVVGSVAVGAVLAAAVAVTIWRYEDSRRLSREALEARAAQVQVGTIVSSFWHEREDMNEYLLLSDP